MVSPRVALHAVLYALLLATPVRAGLPSNGLVARYDFSGNANDSLTGPGKGPHGTVFGAMPVADRFGHANSAYSFDGAASYIEFPDSEVFSVTTTGALAVSVWVRPEGTSRDPSGNLLFSHQEGSGFVHWMGKGRRGQHEWAFRIYSADNKETPNRVNRMSTYLFNPAGGLGAGSFVQEKVAPGQWIHYVSVVDLKAQTVTWYKNGVKRDQDSFAATSSYPITPAHGPAPLRIGTRDFASFFAGAVDDLRIYDRNLSAAEVKQLYLERP